MAIGIKTVKFANIAAFIVTILVNFAANALPLNGVTTAEVSDKYANLFTPAGYVFAIWGVIYILLAAFTYYQYKASDELHEKIGWYFVGSCLFNSVWIFLWHYQYLALSLFAMAGLLGCLALIYTRLEIGLVEVDRQRKYMVNTTFSVYTSWIIIASIANVAAFLVDMGWKPYNITAVYSTVTMILIALLLTAINIHLRGDIAYSAVVVWALSGIMIEQFSNWLIPYVAGLSMVAIIVCITLKKLGKLG
jgi:hypothetical protein